MDPQSHAKIFLAIFLKVQSISEGRNRIKNSTATIFCYETFLDRVGQRSFVKVI
jgi:hypothetical protein